MFIEVLCSIFHFYKRKTKDGKKQPPEVFCMKRCFTKGALEILQNSQDNTCSIGSFQRY